MRVQPLIPVRNVEASSRWYQELPGRESGHGGSEYERLVKDGEILQLHAWGAHDYPNPGRSRCGAKWLRRAALVADQRLRRCGRALGADLIQEPFVNPNARHLQCWIRDLDDDVVVLASRDGEVG
jgi:hypothetical protein